MSETERLAPEELKTLFLFEQLSDQHLSWLADRGRVVEYPAGATIHAEGSPSSCFLVLLSGTMVMTRRVQGGELELFRSDYRGSYTGAFDAYLPDDGVPKMYVTTARAVTDCRLFELPAADFGKAVRKWFPMAAHLLEGNSIQGRFASETIERHERLVALGSVTAGLTHELNNPVAAVIRATASLRERLKGMRTRVGMLARGGLDADQLDTLVDLVRAALEQRGSIPRLSPLESSDREDKLADWLDDHAVPNGYELASVLVAAGLGIEWTEELAAKMPPDHLPAALSYAATVLEGDSLLDEIAEAAGRISTLLASAKQYTQMDRSPLQTFDVHEGLDATLTMLSHKIGDHIDIVRDYAHGLPKISAYPGELNQVWTNLVDNAVDAMDGHGTLTVRTRADGDERLIIEICDTGPGVPETIRHRVFEPFFTTKDIGHGTGLGLDIAWRIVVGRHGGDIRLDSSPGDTRFQVILPIREHVANGE